MLVSDKDRALKKNLLIEDDEYLRLLIERFLKSQGFNVLTAENGFIGLILAKEQKPDLIVCDIKMPVLDGYGVLENIRKDFKIASIPVFFISFYADDESISRAYQLGVNDYLKKPLDLNELLAKIKHKLNLTVDS